MKIRMLSIVAGPEYSWGAGRELVVGQHVNAETAQAWLKGNFAVEVAEPKPDPEAAPAEAHAPELETAEASPEAETAEAPENKRKGHRGR